MWLSHVRVLEVHVLCTMWGCIHTYTISCRVVYLHTIMRLFVYLNCSNGYHRWDLPSKRWTSPRLACQQTCVHTYVRKYVSPSIYTHTYVCTCIHMHMHMYVHTYIHAYIPIHVQFFAWEKFSAMNPGPREKLRMCTNYNVLAILNCEVKSSVWVRLIGFQKNCTYISTYH